jgi:3-hydroxyisobutyrate dehydrogenase-like beta-hydroxyacid dehydrogenase
MRGTIAVLGLGEAGGALARDLAAAGAVVRGYDPAVPVPAGIATAGSEAEAAEGAAVVLSVNSASAARGALTAGLAGLGPDALWADLNTASPGVKRDLAGSRPRAARASRTWRSWHRCRAAGCACRCSPPAPRPPRWPRC